MKVISTRMHGVLDYLTAGLLFALLRLMDWSDRVTTLLTVLAIGTVLYSLLTRYELGAFRALPMRAHLALDFMSGALLLAVVLLWGDEPSSVRMILGGLGLWEIGAALMTDPEPSAVTDGTASVGRTRSPGF